MSSEKPDFLEIKHAANGMLDPKVYEAIYDTAQNAKTGILEIGTAHGAGTIALALGAPRGVRIVTVDKMVGGSRDRYGDTETNRDIVLSNFERFGVKDRIELVIGSAEEAAGAIDLSAGLDLLLLDADGAIDRDFALFYDALTPGSDIIIDDYGPCNARVVLNGPSEVRIDQKHRLCMMLTDYFESRGLIEKRDTVFQTYFGKKPAGVSFSADAEEVVQLYREMTFGNARTRSIVFQNMSNLSRRLSPRLHQKLKDTAT